MFKIDKNLFIEIDSILIGIKLWLIPQISEHWPNKIEGLFKIIFFKLIWLGKESILIFNDGIVHEWITSIEEIKIIILKLNGKNNLLSFSKILKLKLFL